MNHNTWSLNLPCTQLVSNQLFPFLLKFPLFFLDVNITCAQCNRGFFVFFWQNLHSKLRVPASRGQKLHKIKLILGFNYYSPYCEYNVIAKHDKMPWPVKKLVMLHSNQKQHYNGLIWLGCITSVTNGTTRQNRAEKLVGVIFQSLADYLTLKH